MRTSGKLFSSGIYSILFSLILTPFYRVILDVAAGVFDSANQLNNLGFIDQSAFLYENVSACKCQYLLHFVLFVLSVGFYIFVRRCG